MLLGQPTRWEHCHDITAVGRGDLDIFKEQATTSAYVGLTNIHPI
jgi:hypothetical protein